MMKNGRTQVSPSTAASIITSQHIPDRSVAADGAMDGQLSFRIDDSRTLVIQIRMRFEVIPGLPAEVGEPHAEPSQALHRGPRAVWRQNRIVEMLQRLGHTPSALAPLPRGAIKGQVFQRLVAEDGTATWAYHSFRNAWQWLRAAGRIADAEPGDHCSSTAASTGDGKGRAGTGASPNSGTRAKVGP